DRRLHRHRAALGRPGGPLRRDAPPAQREPPDHRPALRHGTARPVAAIPRRNMLREDEVFAAKLALAGPWGHVSEVLAHRHWKLGRIGVVARRLGVPAWQSHFSNTLQFRELLAWVRTADLTDAQRRRARAAV